MPSFARIASRVAERARARALDVAERARGLDRGARAIASATRADWRARTRGEREGRTNARASADARGRPSVGFASAHAVPREEVTYDDAGPINPFKIVDEELRAIGERMRRAVTSDIPALSTASEYFFKLGAEGKRVRPTVLMLMASAMTNGVMTSAARGGWRETDHAPRASGAGGRASATTTTGGDRGDDPRGESVAR